MSEYSEKEGRKEERKEEREEEKSPCKVLNDDETLLSLEKREYLESELKKHETEDHLDYWTKRNYTAALKLNSTTPLRWK